MNYTVVTGAAGFIGSCMLQKLHEDGIDNLVAVDDFSKTEKARNTDHKPYIHKVNRTEFFSWLEMNAGQVGFVIHLGARTDTTETRWELFQELNLRLFMPLPQPHTELASMAIRTAMPLWRSFSR